MGIEFLAAAVSIGGVAGGFLVWKFSGATIDTLRAERDDLTGRLMRMEQARKGDLLAWTADVARREAALSTQRLIIVDQTEALRRAASTSPDAARALLRGVLSPVAPPVGGGASDPTSTGGVRQPPTPTK